MKNKLHYSYLIFIKHRKTLLVTDTESTIFNDEGFFNIVQITFHTFNYLYVISFVLINVKISIIFF